MSEITSIVTALLRPVRFASKDNFAHLKTVKNLEELVDGLVARAIDISDNKADIERFMGLRNLFLSFDNLKITQREAHLAKAELILNSFISSSITIKATKTASGASKGLIDLSPVEFDITQALTCVKGIGDKLALRLAKKGLCSVEDMLYYLPIRYEDRRNLKKIRELTVGESGVTTGEVVASGEARYGKRRVFEVAISDSSGIITAKWFHYRTAYMKKLYTTGSRVVLYGAVGSFGARKDMVHPDVEFIDSAGETDTAPMAALVPIYSQIDNFHQKTIRKLVGNIVRDYADNAQGAIPTQVIERLGLIPLADAIKGAHALFDGDVSAKGEDEARKARKSLVFDELFSLELSMAMKRRDIKREDGLSLEAKGEKDKKTEKMAEKLIKSLEFDLTNAQKRVFDEILADMKTPHPMNRLLQGDVGSGKTIVSLLAIVTAIDAGFQTLIMAPTEILAEQHYKTMKKLTAPLDIEPILLTGRLKKSDKDKALKAISSGEAVLIVGTHAILERDVKFHSLGFAVIDEQHRFGVMQRARFKSMGPATLSPDILIMSATPIPRTLALTVFGDMDVSILDELPKGRRPVTTKILSEKERAKAYRAVREVVASGGQAYIIYPLVEQSEALNLKDATNMYAEFDNSIFPELTVGLIHGRLKSAQKESIMESFNAGRIDILVATTVVEVGLDVPNASLMVIEHAERFGLSQLHQLRGRVGRGARASTCILLAQWTGSDDALKRLRVMRSTQDGFVVAQEDLNIRGPGDFLGKRQSGLPDFRLAEALKDMNLLKTAREEAIRFLDLDPELSSCEARRIVKVIEARWKGRLELSQVG